MPTGIGLHIGVNSVDPLRYPGLTATLPSAEADAQSMFSISQKAGFYTKYLLTAKATANEVLAEIENASRRLTEGDIFLLSYSGHGFRIHDPMVPPNETDLDDAWALFDRLITDDELNALLGTFRSGVRVLVISDSCDSGAIITAEQLVPRTVRLGTNREEQLFAKALPGQTKQAVLVARRQSATSSLESSIRSAFEAEILLLAASKKDEEAQATPTHGCFTQALLETWADGAFTGDYDNFLFQISNCKCLMQLREGNLERFQTPVLRLFGPSQHEFLRQRPFTI